VCKKCSNRVVSAKAKAKKNPHVDPEQPVLPPVVELVEEPSDDAAFLELKRKLSEAEARIVTLSSAVPEKTKTKKPAKRKKPRTSQKRSLTSVNQHHHLCVPVSIVQVGPLLAKALSAATKRTWLIACFPSASRQK